jgi:hypothetical protein
MGLFGRTVWALAAAAARLRLAQGRLPSREVIFPGFSFYLCSNRAQRIRACGHFRIPQRHCYRGAYLTLVMRFEL